MTDRDTVIFDKPTTKSRIKQHLAFAIIIARQYSDELIFESEALVKDKTTLNTLDQGRLDAIIEDLQSLQMSIALIQTVSEYLLFRNK